MTPEFGIGILLVIYGALTGFVVNPLAFDRMNALARRRGMWAVAVTIAPLTWLGMNHHLGEFMWQKALFVSVLGAVFGTFLYFVGGVIIGMLTRLMLMLAASLWGVLARR